MTNKILCVILQEYKCRKDENLLIYEKSSRETKIKIKNVIFTDKIIYGIQPLGFSILSYLLYESRNTTDMSTTISILMEFFNIKRKETIINHLTRLRKFNLINFKENLNETNIHKKLEIDLTNYYSLQGGYEQISGSIFIDNYINEYAWTILCLLCKLNHVDYGNAKLTQEEIGYHTGIKHRQTIKNNLQKLEEKNLITIENNKTYFDPFTSTEKNSGYYPISKSSKYIINFYKE